MQTWTRWLCYVISLLTAWLCFPLLTWFNSLWSHIRIIDSCKITCNPELSYNVESVLHQALALPSHSWEYGTAAEALLEFESPALSVFGLNPFPAGRIPKIEWRRVKALSYVKPFITIDGTTLFEGDGRLFSKHNGLKKVY
jgi:hypothetical protein